MAKGKPLFLHVPLQEKILFTRHLAIGIKSGMSLIGSLELIKDQTKSGSLKRILKKLISDVNSGVFLSKSLEQFEGVFGNLFINVIRIGETSGTLTENLKYIAEELQKKQVLRSKIRGALIYPAVILVATIGISVGLVVFIFPKILPVFQSINVQLPVTTRILIATTNALNESGLLILGIFILFIFALVLLFRVRAFKHVIHHVYLYTPFVRTIVVRYNIANFSRTLALLLKSGVNITEAVRVTAATTSNLAYEHELQATGRVLQKGEFLSSYLSKNKKMFPPIVSNMIRVGENTGNLTENLEYLSEYYEEQVDYFVKNLSSILEPALMVIMGVIVGFIALSIITPIYSLTQGLTQ